MPEMKPEAERIMQAALANGSSPIAPTLTHAGLSKREFFAAMALNGLLASGQIEPSSINSALMPALYAADRLLIELERK
jgi:hypothetical protein